MIRDLKEKPAQEERKMGFRLKIRGLRGKQNVENDGELE